MTDVRTGIVEGDDFSVFPPIVINAIRRLRALFEPGRGKSSVNDVDDDEASEEAERS